MTTKPAQESIQIRLRGVWTEIGGCPHYSGGPEGPAICRMDGRGHSCVYETGGERCDEFLGVIEQWKEEAERVDGMATHRVRLKQGG